MKTIYKILIVLLGALLSINAQANEWENITNSSKGQTVYFNAWGGSEAINDYIRWAGKQVKKRYGLTIKHVKVTDVGDVISRIIAEKAVNRNSAGSVDLIWINGENFRSLKDNHLLFGPFLQKLPNYQLVDFENKPTILSDFTTPVENMEAPWGMAQLIFMYDASQVTNYPKNMKDLLIFAKKHPGKITYPAPPSFYGTTFLKQVLLEMAEKKYPLYHPVKDANFEATTAPLWKFLDQLHPFMWRKGKAFTSGAPEMKQLLNDREILISLSFNPNDASNAIASGELPETIRTYIHDQGTIGNTHFVAIPFNSDAKEGAMVFANFLMSPEAQLKKSIPKIWGDPTVLNVNKLSVKDKKAFSQLPLGVATLSSIELKKVLLEPDTSWVAALEKAWQRRYQK
ncbi:MAG: ABC transporter substrate-binding protein [Prolixibacteraceae bacterium]|jgi:putative thiamine transport system substrate-binding protein|nr:ABC transporter substrate-binding protein [Deltaproteobacteria bacterium]MBT4527999.1 ABC transporter substrate-binding protein [Deltaproteobacteria bacterium]MBT6006886.1 ABC transporter substrate-binding protein [Prolixibacteraceae bacterium]